MTGGSDSIALLRQDLVNQAKSISAIVGDQNGIRDSVTELRHVVELEIKVRAVTDGNTDKRLERIERSIADLKKEAEEQSDAIRTELKVFRDEVISWVKWALKIVGGAVLLMIVGFALSGGFKLPPP